MRIVYQLVIQREVFQEMPNISIDSLQHLSTMQRKIMQYHRIDEQNNMSLQETIQTVVVVIQVIPKIVLQLQPCLRIHAHCTLHVRIVTVKNAHLFIVTETQ